MSAAAIDLNQFTPELAASMRVQMPPAADAGVSDEERKAEAERFLTLLDEDADVFCFQTFDDLDSRKSPKLAAVEHGTLDSLWSWLDAKNKNGAGIFVTINEVEAGAARTIPNVVRVRAVFADFDPPKTAPAPAKYPLPPAWQVESSPGKRHAYWPVDGLPLADFQPLMRTIIASLKSDTQPNDLPRVMRLPGFYHRKNPATPHLVRLIDVDDRLPYRPEQIAAAFAPPPNVNPEVPSQTETRKGHDDYLAELMDGEDVHGNILRTVGRMVREGLTDPTIKTVCAGLAVHVAAARGQERTNALLGSELARMIQGAREKGYGGSPLVDCSALTGAVSGQSAPDDAHRKLTQSEAESLIAWSWRTGKTLPPAREQFEGDQVNPKTGKPFDRLRVRIGIGDNSGPWISLGWQSQTAGEFIERADAQIDTRFSKDTGDKETAGPDDFKRHARQWAESVAALEVSDEAAQELLARITPPWPEPQPITVKVDSHPYPLDALPATVLAAVEEVHGFVKAPLPMVASSALSALSLAMQAHYDVRRAEKLSGPVSLYLMTIADSGERKTTVDGFFTGALREFQARASEAAKPDLKRYAANMASWKAKQEGVLAATRDAAKKAKPTGELDAEMERLEENMPEPPRIPKLLLGDETPESLAWSLAKSWPSSGVISSEAGVIFGAHGMGKDSIMRNLALLNIAWDGGELPVGRKTTDSFVMRGVRLTVALQIQEPTLRSFFDRSGGLARGTGFLARFLFAWPESTQGYRPFTEAREKWPHLEAFDQRLTAILEQAVPITEDGTLEPVMLTLSPEAKAAWIAFADDVEVELRPSGELYDVRDVASKCADNAVRIAALFHIFEGGIGPISLDAFEGASRIAAWHLTEARRFFGELALPSELVDAAKLDAWLIEHCRRHRSNTVGKRHVRQHGPLRDGARLDTAIGELIEMDRLRVEKDGRKIALTLNPALCEAES